METEDKSPFTAAQFHGLTREQQQAVMAVGEYLTSKQVEISDEGLGQSLNLLRPCPGCVPPEEADEDLRAAIRRKFGAIYGVAMEVAEAELRRKGFRDREAFSFCLVIEPSHEDATHVAVVDYNKPVCYLHEWSKAWHFGFATLAELAGAVLTAKAAIINRVMANKPKEMLIVVQDGTVREVAGLPDNTQVVVANYDIEDVEKLELTTSPLDGKLCKLTKF
ncbi:MAG: hypothetical protein ACREIC_28255 [Limisphaerales bacterium]